MALGGGFIVAAMTKTSVLSVLVFGCLVVLTSGGWAQTYTNGNWQYTLNASNEATITSYTGEEGPLVVPNQIDSHPVKVIGQNVFRENQKITSVTLEEGIEFIDIGAFAYCYALTNVITPDSLKNIEAGAFFGCASISHVRLGNSLTNIGDSAFHRNLSLSNISLPNSLVSIAQGAFSGCWLPGTFYIPSSVTNIGDGILIGSGVTEIVVHADNQHYVSMEGVLFRKSHSTLIQFPSARTGSYEIPSGVNAIARMAFAFGNIESVTTTSSLRSLEDLAFDGCSFLTNVTFVEGLTHIGDSPFRHTSLKELSLPDSLVNHGGKVVGAANELRSINIGSGLTSIGYFGEGWSPVLTNISVHAENPHLASIDGVLFNKQLTELIKYPPGKSGSYVVPPSVTKISSHSFNSATALTNISIPPSVQDIGDYAFAACTGLKSLRIPANVDRIRWRTFGAAGLERLIIEGGVNTFEWGSLSVGPTLQSVLFLGDRPTDVNEEAFLTDTTPTVYYLGGASGWTSTFAGRPALPFDQELAILYAEAEIKKSPNAFGLYSETQYQGHRLQGQTDVTTNPSAFNLFTSQQFDGNRTAGQSDVISNPMSYGLYTSDSIMDLRMGGLMIQRQGSSAVVTFQTQTTTDLATQPFTNNGTAITNVIPMPGNKGFIRINAKP